CGRNPWRDFVNELKTVGKLWETQKRGSRNLVNELENFGDELTSLTEFSSAGPGRITVRPPATVGQ
uniref:Uncharacterized protein n=1 Tax=Romanomermis culicivorax TaxID=13658 RepID=A0A915IHH0_ROMCU